MAMERQDYPAMLVSRNESSALGGASTLSRELGVTDSC